MANRENPVDDRTIAERRDERGDVPVTQRRTESTGLGRAGFTSPFGMMRELSSEMSRLFNNFGFGSDLGFRGFGESTWVPQLDVLRRGENVVVRADLPGLSKDDISIDVTNDVLTIRGERREEHKQEREGYYLHERSEGSFERSIPLPEGADVDKAEARFENGVLEVSMPAPEREQRRGRRIEIG